MNWDKIVGQKKLVQLLQDSILDKRVSHAQLFLAPEGYGSLPLALAYAKAILADENLTAASKVEHLNHLDLHFSFPTFTEKNNSLSKRYFEEFRSLILENPYASLDDFTKLLESENKQFFISADEMEAVGSSFSLKSFEGGTKILIIWRADKMNSAGANKFLKFLEEPPAKTLIFLTAESADDMLPTILSRCQIINVPRIEDEDIALALKSNYKLTEDRINEIVHQAQGNYNEAIRLATHGDYASEFDELFVQWVRNAFMVKKKPEYLRHIIKWAREIASWNREKQKTFLDFCSEIFRLALMQNYGKEDLVYKSVKVTGFRWQDFSKYIHGSNIESILEEISTAGYHIERNGNAKIVWTDMGIKLSRYIHRSAL